MNADNKFPVACIYHQHCWDGIGAAWLVKKYFAPKDVQLFPGIYQQDPDYEALACFESIYIVDFSYPPEVLDILAHNSKIILLDHHASAIEKLKNYSNPDVQLVFNVDNTQSGIGVVYEYFYGNLAYLPLPLAYIQDRDIWAWKLDGTKDFTAALQLYPITMKSMEKVMASRVETLLDQGVIINQVLASQIEKVLASSGTTNFEGFQAIPIVNCPPYLMSEALHILAETQPFAIGWYYDEKKSEYHYSLRSSATGEDVSKLASEYGGGGHAHAAGFVSPHNVLYV